NSRRVGASALCLLAALRLGGGDPGTAGLPRANGPRRSSGGWCQQLVQRLYASALSGNGASTQGAADLESGRPAAFAWRTATAESGILGGSESEARGAFSR